MIAGKSVRLWEERERRSCEMRGLLMFVIMWLTSEIESHVILDTSAFRSFTFSFLPYNTSYILIIYLTSTILLHSLPSKYFSSRNQDSRPYDVNELLDHVSCFIRMASSVIGGIREQQRTRNPRMRGRKSHRRTRGIDNMASLGWHVTKLKLFCTLKYR